MRRTLAVATVLTVLISACGSETEAEAPVSLGDLTETWGCGHGFWIGNPEQTRALRFRWLGDQDMPADADLPDQNWEAVLLEGRDLYANWCDDVIEPGEPEPQVFTTIEVVEGTLEVTGEPAGEPFRGTPLVLEAESLVIRMPSGEPMILGDATIENPTYGFLAG